MVRKQDFAITDVALLPLFNGVPVPLLEQISSEMVRFYQDGEVIFAEGDHAHYLVVLLHGQVRILLNGIFLVARSAPAVLGEQAFLNETTRSATAIAQGLVQALVLPQSLVEHLLTDVVFLRNLLRQVSEKLTEASNERAFHFRNEQLLFSEFRAHLSPEITHRLLATGRAYGDPRYVDAIILFSDIRSFTERSAGMAPQEIASELGPYLDATVNLIHQHEGLVDKFVGDAVMAIWGYAPTEEDLVARAFTCARDMLRLAQSMSFGGAPIAIGVGLNAGRVFLGNIGSMGKRQFTVLGSPVNLAARFESETKVLGAPIVVGKAFYERLPPHLQCLLRKHENCPIKGVEPQTVYVYQPVEYDHLEEEHELELSTQ